MSQMVEFLVKYGYGILFVSILARQACLPVPANLLLVAAGALARMGELNLAAVVLLSVSAFLAADLAWFEAGRRLGTRTIQLICRVSKHPVACEKEVVTKFNLVGVRALLFSKFVLGLDSVAAPMSGIVGIRRTQFLLFDFAGALLWSSAYASVGFIFSKQLDQIARYSTQLGTVFVVAGVAIVGVMIVRRLMLWNQFLREFRVDRVTPEELRDALISGDRVVLLDIQDDKSRATRVMAIPGAVRIDPRLLSSYRRSYRDDKLPIDREVVLYCSCPDESASARLAYDLLRRGFAKVKPLAGGLQAWVDRGFPVTSHVPTLPAKEHAAYVLRDILQYSREEAARLLNQEPADLDNLLSRARTRIGYNASASSSPSTSPDSDLRDGSMDDSTDEVTPRGGNGVE